jgi:hypothetical protein
MYTLQLSVFKANILIPVRMASKSVCHRCGREKSHKTIRRHLKYGCTQTEQRETHLRLAADAALARLHQLITTAHRQRPAYTMSPRPIRVSRHYHHRNPPLGQSPHTPQVSSRQSSPQLHDNHCSEVGYPDPHPDARFDTHGAGPGPSSRQRSPRFSDTPPAHNAPRTLTLEDVNPELAGMDVIDYLTQTTHAGMARNAGKLS